MRQTIFVLFLLVGLLVVGCSAPTSNEPTSNVPTNTGTLSDPVVRTFSGSTVANSGTVTVTLTKTLSADQTTLLVEENFPPGFTIVDAGTGTANGNTIRWAELTGAKSGTYAYTIQAPANTGTYTFSGQYSVSGTTPVNIAGSTQIIVQ